MPDKTEPENVPFVFSQFVVISPGPNWRLAKTGLVWICNDNNFKKTCCKFARKDNPTQKVT